MNLNKALSAKFLLLYGFLALAIGYILNKSTSLNINSLGGAVSLAGDIMVIMGVIALVRQIINKRKKNKLNKV